MRGQQKISVASQPWSELLAVRFGIDCGDGEFDIAEPIQLRRIPINTTADPFLELHPDTAQKLMDQLWQCGLRPTEGTGSAGAMAAVQKHLEDMRTLVFKPTITKSE